MGMNAAATAMGSVSTGINADRRWNRKNTITSETTTASSISADRSVAIDCSMSPDRS